MKVSELKLPCIVEWEEPLCLARKTFKVRREKIISKRGYNIETATGDWLWWKNIQPFNPKVIQCD